MKKNIILSIIIVAGIAFACQKTPEIEAVPPIGVWEELIYVPVVNSDGTPSLQLMRYAEMTPEQQDTLKYVCWEIDFGDDGTLRAVIRYGDGRDTPASCEKPDGSNRQRTDFIEAQYSCGKDNNKNIGLLNVNGGFIDMGACSSKGPFNRLYTFTYDNEDRDRMTLGYDDVENFTQVFVKKANPQ